MSSDEALCAALTESARADAAAAHRFATRSAAIAGASQLFAAEKAEMARVYVAAGGGTAGAEAVARRACRDATAEHIRTLAATYDRYVRETARRATGDAA